MSKDTHHTAEPAALILCRLPQVRIRTGLSRSEIYRRIAGGDFPKPIKLGPRASAWAEHEVTAWIAARIAARDGKPQA
jgi:prophage regulatory protein